jgi:hypothetical protein
MKIYEYFFHRIYKWASSNKNDYTPEHTALLFTSQSVFFNLMSILNILDSTLKYTTQQYLTFIGTLGLSCVVLNYFIFLRNKKYLDVVFENSNVKNIVFLIYLCGTYYLYFCSLYVLVPTGK